MPHAGAGQEQQQQQALQEQVARLEAQLQAVAAAADAACAHLSQQQHEREGEQGQGVAGASTQPAAALGGFSSSDLNTNGARSSSAGSPCGHGSSSCRSAEVVVAELAARALEVQEWAAAIGRERGLLRAQLSRLKQQMVREQVGGVGAGAEGPAGQPREEQQGAPPGLTHALEAGREDEVCTFVAKGAAPIHALRCALALQASARSGTHEQGEVEPCPSGVQCIPSLHIDAAHPARTRACRRMRTQSGVRTRQP